MQKSELYTFSVSFGLRIILDNIDTLGFIGSVGLVAVFNEDSNVPGVLDKYLLYNYNLFFFKLLVKSTNGSFSVFVSGFKL